MGAQHALLIIDMFNPLSFPGAERLAPNALAIAEPISSMARQLHQAGGHIFFVNDDVAKGGTTAAALQRAMEEHGGTSSAIARRLDTSLPSEVILKPQHSGFFQTRLDARLRALDLRSVFLVGVAADLCVMATAIDASMRGFEVQVVSNLVASETQGRLRRGLLLLKTSFRIQVAAWNGARPCAARA
jgi:nicotinamidase-related amidase